MDKIVIPKNRLKEKTGGGGFNQEDLSKAQTALEEYKIDFLPIAEKYLALINHALEQYKKDKESGPLYSSLLDQLTQLRAQGAMFHYPSVTFLTDVVNDLLETLQTVDGTIIEIVRSYEKSMKLVLSTGVKSDKDKVCVALHAELKNVCEKYKQRMQPGK